MDEVYIFTWETNSANAYTYGSRIQKDLNGAVHFKNELHPVGQAIYSWRNMSGNTAGDQGVRASVVLPSLQPGRAYHFVLSADATPQDSIGLTLDFFDRTGTMIEHLVFTEREADFVYPEGTVDYRIDLVRFNNTALTFNWLLLLPSDCWKKYAIVKNDGLNTLALERRGVASPQTIKLIFQRQHEPLDVGYIDSKFDAIYNVLLPSRYMRSDDQLEAYLKELIHHFKTSWDAAIQVEVQGIGPAMKHVLMLFEPLLKETQVE
ncbi:accessory Sec system protein Asp3 [Weissella uvarum]|uniref:accessory Sec system protein Asp3 n=1 Tax=Weissella uvarum TaxID=1479233 RepID=UPI00195F4112|nr:accessory Sec system protein Asp3 [Weissella uvarum]MBM7616674.1 accessory Sec system protein Asp3 [Weissella uvarum]MCM0594872.1 accessory Sec system protein Asp3 [Weissella uvarum]